MRTQRVSFLDKIPLGTHKDQSHFLSEFLEIRHIITILKNMFRNKKCIGSNLQDV